MIERAIIRTALTCDCGKKHFAAHASTTSICACGRRLGARLFYDEAKQEPPTETRKDSE